MQKSVLKQVVETNKVKIQQNCITLNFILFSKTSVLFKNRCPLNRVKLSECKCFILKKLMLTKLKFNALHFLFQIMLSHTESLLMYSVASRR